MASLSTSLSTAVQSLDAATGASAGNEQQHRQREHARLFPPGAGFSRGGATNEGSLSVGNGVVLEGFQSVRDELVQSQIQQETQAQSGANAQLASLQQIQPTFTTSTQDIGTQCPPCSRVFPVFRQIPPAPLHGEAVLSAGQNLATAFNTASNTLTSQQAGLNTQVTQDVSQINQLTQQIAALNPQIAS
jgi:flagellar hook-associated protein 1 FlgK